MGEGERPRVKLDFGPAVKRESIEEILRSISPENIFILEPNPDSDEFLNLKVAGNVYRIEWSSNPAFVARSAVTKIYEVLGENTPEPLAIVFRRGVFEDIPGMIVLYDGQSIAASKEIVQALRGFDIKVIERIVQIAEEIAEEGREGRKIGTLFVIGNPDELAPYLRQLVLNPFKGYLPEERNIFNDDLKETIKEFAQLDGAFVVSKDGYLVSAGTYIDVDTSEVRRYPGWGTRHLAAAAITTKTDSVAVLVSHSGGKIKVFRKGKIVLRR